MSAATADGSGAMFDRIARRYDLLNRLMSFGVDRGWRRRLIAAMPIEGELLDVATGTADVALALARSRPACSVVGLDPSANMLAVGQEKIVQADLEARVALVEGDAQAMPFAADRFAGATIAFGIRNVPDRLAGLREMARVTRPGGPVAVLELSEPTGGPLAALARFHVHHIVPRLGAWLSGDAEYRYLQRSIAAFPPADAFAELMREAGLRDVRATRLTMGTAHLYVGYA
ncbi:MAG: ubiquinone/menaquinone biosynthesis methyltransferase [Myxococcales bacterium]|nr:ubiquinone/menaquinone biosynthesis methyltransferase [Myxococcales bacterium]